MANVQEILDSIKELKLLEVAELVKMMEEEFGVSAAAPVMVAQAQARLKSLNSTLFLLTQALQSSALSRLLEKSQVLVLRKQKLLLTKLRRRLKKLLPRTKLKA